MGIGQDRIGLDSLDMKALRFVLTFIVIVCIVVFVLEAIRPRPLKVDIGQGIVAGFEVTTIRNFLGDYHEYITTVELDDGRLVVIESRKAFAAGTRVALEEFTNGFGYSLRRL